MNIKQLLTAGSLAALAGLAIAGPPWGQRGGPPTFADIDTDANGAVTAQEFESFHAQRMAQRAAEGCRMRNAGQHPRFQAMDLNGDEVISKAELHQWRAGRMAERRRGL